MNTAPADEWKKTTESTWCSGCDDELPEHYLCFVKAGDYYYCQDCARSIFCKRPPIGMVRSRLEGPPFV